MKRYQHSWGEEIVIGAGERVVRIYVSAKKITIDMSQIRDTSWDRWQRAAAKYPGTTKVVLPPNTSVQPIIDWWQA